MFGLQSTVRVSSDGQAGLNTTSNWGRSKIEAGSQHMCLKTRDPAKNNILIVSLFLFPFQKPAQRCLSESKKMENIFKQKAGGLPKSEARL